MFSIKGFLIDRDGVLTVTDGEIPLQHLLGLEQVSKYVSIANTGNFPQIAICTGREWGSAESAYFDIGRPQGWSGIIESGVFVVDFAAKKIRKNPALTKEVEEAFQEISRSRIPQVLAQYPKEALFLYPGNQICIAIERRLKSRVTIEQLAQDVRQQLKDLINEKIVAVHASSIAVDISPAAIDKYSGVFFFCELTGINPGDLFGIGDSLGDEPMFKAVGRIGCPSGANDPCKGLVKERGGIISAFPYAAGVADIIYQVTGVRPA